jgi:hypothetical protein
LTKDAVGIDEIRLQKSELNLNFNKPEELSRVLLELFFYLSFLIIRFFTTTQRKNVWGSIK